MVHVDTVQLALHVSTSVYRANRILFKTGHVSWIAVKSVIKAADADTEAFSIRISGSPNM